MRTSLIRFCRSVAGFAFLGLLVAAGEGIAAGDTGTTEEAKGDA